MYKAYVYFVIYKHYGKRVNNVCWCVLQKYYQHHTAAVSSGSDDEPEEGKMSCGDYVQGFIGSCKIYAQVFKKVCLVWKVKRILHVFLSL